MREELEKEEFYVEYLEHLLADVEKQKTRAAGDGEAAGEDASSRTDSSESGIESSDASRKFSKSCSQNSIDLCISELADVVPTAERNKSSPPAGSERSISVDETQRKLEEREKAENLETRPRSSTQPNLSNFVTVIEINGKGKKKVELPKKCPPKPPPKTFKLDLDAKSKSEESEKRRAAPTVPSPTEPSIPETPSDGNKTAGNVAFSENENRETPYGKIKKPAALPKPEESVPEQIE